MQEDYGLLYKSIQSDVSIKGMVKITNRKSAMTTGVTFMIEKIGPDKSIGIIW